MNRILTALAVGLLLPNALFAQRNLKVIPDTNPDVQRDSFIVADGFEVNLYASDPAIAKPIQMNFDAQGRLWVASSSIYPQIKPGQVANDKIIVLEDADHDGVAEKSTVFADGLLIPTGVLPGDGGVYVANSTELLHLKDTNGDGKSDTTRVVLSGFGTEDTHHILHTLRWGHDGMMYFNQSIYIHSHIETPHGVRRLNGGGIWRFRPETMELDVLAKGLVNTWGHHFDQWGANFATDGAGGQGINYVFPGAVFLTSPGARRVVSGMNPGSPKYCGLEIISGSHLPDDWQGNCITADFRAHRVCRFILEEDGSGYVSRQTEELLKTKHGSFRPIDIKMGPDGAIYIADFYNPIIQHGEVDFRDERRDHTHGRIWRVSRKGAEKVKQRDLVNSTIPELLEALKAKEEWVRLHAKLILKSKGAKAVLPELVKWIANLDQTDSTADHQLLEGLWVYQSLDVVNEPLLAKLLNHNNPQVRAAAVRVCGQWFEHLKTPNKYLAAGVNDSHPRVRLESVRVAADHPSLESVKIIADAHKHSIDKSLDFALWTAANDLQSVWLPAIEQGEIDIAKNPQYWLFNFTSVSSGDIVKPALELISEDSLSSDVRKHLLNLVAQRGNAEHLGILFNHIVEIAAENSARSTELLSALTATTVARKIKPQGDLTRLASLLDSKNSALVQAAALAAGSWKLESLRETVTHLSNDAANPSHVGAINALARFGGKESINQLNRLAITGKTYQQKRLAVEAMSRVAPILGSRRAVDLLKTMTADQNPADVLNPFLSRKGGGDMLATSLKDVKLDSDISNKAIRVVRSTTTPSAKLLEALKKSGNLTSELRVWTDQQLKEITQAAVKSGDPAKGELIYRRKELSCLKCHAIGEAGGVVGPNMISLGASAPVDYIVESLLRPSAKVKENFHSLIILTDAGQVVSGIPVRRTDTDLVLRDAEDRQITIPLDSIEREKEGRSLMPDGAMDSLTRAEIVDLVRFISELGKEGPYGVDSRKFVRRWKVLPYSNAANGRLNRTSTDIAATDDPAFQWVTEYAMVSGKLPIDGLPTFKPHRNGDLLSFVRAEFDVTTAGEIVLEFANIKGIAIWVDESPTPIKKQMKINWKKGKHRLTLAISRNDPVAPLQVQLLEAKSSGRAIIVSGK
ncbi:MAG: sorbosone dehydrogenase [Blastopirellula sp.]|nr:MAG: sorbosone dehydrogenase [Blastopirellula sp.]